MHVGLPSAIIRFPSRLQHQVFALSTAKVIFDTTTRTLPPLERLRLASLILDELSHSPTTLPGYDDGWSDDDLHDLQPLSIKRMDDSYPEDDDLA